MNLTDVVSIKDEYLKLPTIYKNVIYIRCHEHEIRACGVNSNIEFINRLNETIFPTLDPNESLIICSNPDYIKYIKSDIKLYEDTGHRGSTLKDTVNLMSIMSQCKNLYIGEGMNNGGFWKQSLEFATIRPNVHKV